MSLTVQDLNKSDILYTLNKYGVKHDYKSSTKSLRGTLTKARKSRKVKRLHKKPKSKKPKTLSKSYRKMSKDRYNKLLSKKRLSSKERKQLNDEMYARFCHCIKGRLVSSKGSYPNSSAYGICTSAVYTKRGRKPPSGAARGCAKRFSWYRKTKY